MSECRNAMSNRSSPGVRMSFRRMLLGLARLFVSRQVFRLSLLLGNPMGMRGDIVQFRGLLVVLVMGSVVIPSGHIALASFFIVFAFDLQS
jgi:hypothetical protein